MSQTVLPTNNSVPVENDVIVAESGDDSDDGWDYIKVNKDKECEIEQQQQPEKIDIQESENHGAPEVEKYEPEHHQFGGSDLEELECDKHQQQQQQLQQEQELVEEDSAITSPTPPTASLGETELIHQYQHQEESHAVAQAYAGPEEACSELLDVKKDIENEEIENAEQEIATEFELERVERSSSVVAEHDSELGIDQDLDEDMDTSSLNPEAAEFVPVSPQRTMSSPLGNGLNAINRPDLLDDDIVSQSPRKGSACVMDNIELPSENDFTDEISQCPSELKPNNDDNIITTQTSSANVQLDFDGCNETSNEMNNTQRPESSSSQCSYQEMNLKEAMHGDEKQEFAAEVHDSEYLVGNLNGNSIGNGDDVHTHSVYTEQNDYMQRSLCEQDPMSMSFYNDGTESGAFENNNPFKEPEVDMNAVQPLPDDIYEDDNKENVANEIEQNYQHQNEGSAEQQHQFHFEQTEMVTFEHGQTEAITAEPAAHFENDEHIEHEELAKESTSESEKLTLQAEHFDDKQQSTITQVVQQMANEVTSVLNDFENQYQAQHQLYDHFSMQNDQLSAFGESYHNNEPQFQPQNIEYSHENNEIPSDVINYSELSVEANEFKPNAAESTFDSESNEQPTQQSNQIDDDSVQPAVTSSNVSTEPLIEMASMETQKREQITKAAVTGAVAVAAAATAAVGATAATKAAKSPIKSTTATRKSSTATTTAKKPITATSKVASKPSTEIKPKATTMSKVAAARAAAPRVTSSAPKSVTASSGTRKPLSNGMSSTINKTTTTTTSSSSVSKTTNGVGTRPTTAPSKTSTPRTVSSTTATKTGTSSTVPKAAAAPRVPLSQRSVAQKPTVASKVAGPTKSVASSSSTSASRVKSAPITTTARSTTLSKPRTTASSDKPLTTTRTSITSKTSPTKTISSTTTTTVKKSPISKTTTTTTNTTTTKKLTPIKKAPTSTLNRTTPSKSPKVPTTNGITTKTASKTAIQKPTVISETVTANGTDVAQKLNGHTENGNAENNAIIDLSTD